MCGRTSWTRTGAWQRFAGWACSDPGARRIFKTVIMVFVAGYDAAKLYVGNRTVDIETTKMLVGAAMVVAIGAFTLLTVGWTLRDMLTDLRAGHAERARTSAAD